MKLGFRWFQNIYAKLLLILLCIAIIPSLISSVFSYQISIKNAKQQSENYSEQLLAQIASANDITYEQMRSFIYEIMINFSYYSDVMEKTPYSAAFLDVRTALDRKRQAYQKHIKNFSIIDLASKKVITSVGGISIYGMDEYRDQVDKNLMEMVTKKDDSLQSNELVLRPTGDNQKVLTYIFKYGPAAAVKGFIAVDVDASSITHPVQAGGYGSLFVRNSKGLMLSDQNLSLFQASQDPSTKSDYVVISQKSTSSGLQYDYVIPKHALTKSSDRVLNSILFISLSLVVLGALAAWMSSKNIYTPLRNLLGYIRGLTGDTLTAAPNMNEINYLEQAFTRMDQENKSYLNMIRSNQNVFKQRQLALLLTGDIAGYQSLEVPSKLRLQWPHDRFLVMTVEIEDVSAFKAKYTQLEQQLLYFAVENITEEVLGEQGAAVAGHLEPYRLSVVFNYSSDRTDHEQTIELCKQLKQQIVGYLHLSVSIGISEAASAVEEIKLCYDQSIRAISYNVYFGKSSIIHYPSVAQMDNHLMFDSNSIQWNEVKEQIKIHFRMNEWDRIEASLTEMIHKVSYIGITKSDVQYIFLQYVACLSDLCVEFSLQLSDVFGKHFYINESAATLSTMEELKLQMTTMAKRLYEKLGEKKTHIHTEMIEQLLHYIEEHIEENITLESIAEKVYMHPAYLSRICKTVTGLSLGEQIVLAKINKAKSLLVHSDDKVGDISERLGYTTPRAFYRIFKDYTGFTPSDFRKREGLKSITE
ncbi:helix-turn-helix domain-containing protein [Paenibacillus albus]|uniref:AraC family transcriptional regulator n=1 Tax=Paenibacillus albus TaxID=2495582 RepID=A0A3Q8X5P9_9BACL|nr:AraC family transcriptional regulator [Paenibacillus albus]AZN41079.1 AraC family transcriptional regulator [Paenibacillus albus]